MAVLARAVIIFLTCYRLLFLYVSWRLRGK
jgi:hypothetical protein